MNVYRITFETTDYDEVGSTIVTASSPKDAYELYLADERNPSTDNKETIGKINTTKATIKKVDLRKRGTVEVNTNWG